MHPPKKQQAVARNHVSRRLGFDVKAKPWSDIEPDQGPSELALPEHLLWLAVIDKAISDYIKHPSDLSGVYRQGLDWFLWETTASPFNLQYLCDLLFEDESTISVIRARVTELKKTGTPTSEKYLRRRYNLRINSRFI